VYAPRNIILSITTTRSLHCCY